MGNYLWARLEVRTVDYQADEKLQELMENKGEPDSLNGVTGVENSEVRDGLMDELESYCVEAGIAFDRSSEATLESRAEIRIFRPGTEPVDERVFVDNNWYPYVLCEKILGILTDEKLTDSEKLQCAIEFATKEDLPVPKIDIFRSVLEQEN